MAENAWEHARRTLRTVAIVLGVMALLLLIRSLQAIVLLVVFSVFFAYLMAPVVELVHHPLRIGGKPRSLSRAMSISLVFASVGGVLATLVFTLVPHLGSQAGDLLTKAPEYLDVSRSRSQLFHDFYQRYNLPPSAQTWMDGVFLQAYDAGRERARVFAMSAVSALRFLPWLVLIPVVAFFLLKDADVFRASALELLPQGRARWRGRDFFEEVNATLASYVRAQLIASAFVAVSCAIAFYIIGVPYSLLIAMLAGVLEFLPMIGAFTVAILACAFDTVAPTPHLVALISFLVALRAVQDYAVYPRVMGTGVHMHPLAVILCLMAGAELGGLPGMILAIPVTAVFSVGYRHFVMNLGAEGLLAELLRSAEPEATAPVLRAHELIAPEPEPEPMPSVPTSTARPKMPRLDGLRVLVVDNEPDARELLVVLLQRCGAQVSTAGSAHEALALVQAEHPDVLVSDIGMPNEDGFDLIRKVRLLAPESGGLTPAAALTAYGTPEDRARALVAGFQTHVPKPVDPIELAIVVSHLAASRHPQVAASKHLTVA